MKKPDILAVLKSFPYDPHAYWVTTGAAMVLYGIREETSDIDLGCTSEMADRLEAAGHLYQVTSDGNRWFKIGSKIEIFENWLYDTVVFVGGIPLISPEGLLLTKQRLGREKDKEDIELINQYINGRCRMPDQDLIKRTEEFVKQKFEEGTWPASQPDARAYRLEHTYRVANIGRKIAAAEGFNETEMVIACLLHDVSYCEEFGENGWREHGRRAAQIARPFLRELGLPEERVNDICFGIAIHVDDEADFPGERTAFALSVGDADNIDRFDAYRIHESLCYEKFLEKSFEEKVAYTEKRLARLRELKDMPLGTKAAEALWQERLSFYIAFYEKLADQLRNSCGIL